MSNPTTSGWRSSTRRKELPPDWEVRRRDVLDEAGGVCEIRWPGCLGWATEVDHIRRGSDHSRRNLQAACQKCHAKKSSAEGNARQRQLRARRNRPPERHPGSL